jgi:membrane protease YdiL (CAAX protease family)
LVLLIINHILSIITLIILPAYVFFDTKRIKASPDPSIKEKTYYKLIAWYWVITTSFLLFSPIENIFFIKKQVILNPTWTIIALIIGAYLLFTHALPIILLTFSDKLRNLTMHSFNNKSYIFPTTNRQLKLFIIVPVTVGICEEIIFRGYLYEYFQSSPYSLSAIISFLIVSFLFGLGHFQQGISGMIETLLLGFLLGLLYFFTGNLILSILLHILFDAKILYVAWILHRHKQKAIP